MRDPKPSREPATKEVEVKRLLVLEDDDAVRYPLVKYLTARGCHAVGAAEPEEAEALLDHETFHLVILLSGHISPEVEAEARRMGATAVLEKPHPLPHLAQLSLDLMGVTR